MGDDAPAPRDIHLLTIDALLADLVGGRAVALGGGEELAIASDDARAVLDWYRQNRGRWQANLSAGDTEAIIDMIGTPPPTVEAAAEARCGGVLVCTSGSASTVVLELLDTLAAAGLRLRYHGDFDWPGIALANRIIRRYSALPWRMAAEDYEQLAAHARNQGSPGLPLAGAPVEASWDADLAAAMTVLNVALHEESALDRLVADLAPGKT